VPPVNALVDLLDFLFFCFFEGTMESTFENGCLLSVALTLLKVQVLHGGNFVAL
jgi:hypothetical protein